MKNAVLICCLVLVLGAIGPVFAVWPPATMLQEEANKPSSAGSAGVSEPTLPRPRGLVENLEEDERHLEKVLRDLEDVKKKLKESNDGHSVR